MKPSAIPQAVVPFYKGYDSYLCNMHKQEEKQIVFYDGECGFCQRTVQLLLRYNKKEPFLYFASLQSTFAIDFFDEKKQSSNGWDSIAFYEKGKFYFASTAVLKIVRNCRILKFLQLGYILPRFCRDKLYFYVAKRRKRLLKNKSNCLVPTTEQKVRFLDGSFTR